MYVAVKGGEKAIESAHRLMAQRRRGDDQVPELSLEQIKQQLSLAVDRVMSEGSVYDRDLAALAIQQAQGDLVEAVFLLRAFRTTLPRLAMSLPVDTAHMTARRRISSCYKDMPGGQVLGPTFDYSHRLLGLDDPEADAPTESAAASGEDEAMPRISALMADEGLLEPAPMPQGDPQPGDLTRQPLSFPAGRDLRLQNLARGDEGFLLAMGYSTQRGFGAGHPFTTEIRMGEVEIWIKPEDLGFEICVGEITLSECDMVSKHPGTKELPPQFVRGYGLSFGYCERKVMAMALADRALRCEELGEEVKAPAQDQEFVLSHSDNVEAWGFTGHLKLPHHVDFQAELQVVRQMREAWQNKRQPQDKEPCYD